MIKKLLMLLLLGSIFWQCSEAEKTTDLEIGRNYYPIEVGNYWIYDVTQTTVLNNVYDSVKYQVRETVDAVYRNQVNEVTYQIIRAKRANAGATWLNDSLYLVNKSISSVQLTHNNSKVVKLLFPVTEGKSWDANAFNIRGFNEYYYQNVGQPYALPDTTYSNTIMVVQGEPNETVLDDRYEIYGYETGMVYKKFKFYEYYQNQSVIDQTRIIKGTKKEMKLISFRVSQ